MKATAAYIRVSTHEQEAHLQREAVERWAQANDVIPVLYQDLGESGASKDRPILQTLLGDIALHGHGLMPVIGTVVVWKLDRLARSLSHLIELLDVFRKHNVQFVSLTESIDTTTPHGELMFHIIGAMAQFERNLLRQRVQAGMDAARARLENGPYRRTRDGKEVVITSLGRPKLLNPTNPSTLRSRKRRANGGQ